MLYSNAPIIKIIKINNDNNSGNNNNNIIVGTMVYPGVLVLLPSFSFVFLYIVKLAYFEIN